MTLSMANVSLNLCQLSKAAALDDCVPGYGHYLYSEGMSKKIWWMIWRLIEKLTGREIIMPKILKSAEKTHEAFKEYAKNIQADVQLFHKQAQRKLKGKSLTNEEVQKGKKRIAEWHTWISPTLHRHVFPNVKGVEKVMDQINGDTNNGKLLVNSYLTDSLSERPLCVIRLESQLGTEFPYEALQNLLRGEFDQSLKYWMEKVDSLRNGNRLLHRALLSIFKPEETTFLEYMLVEKTDTKIFLKPDSVQVAWREDLKTTKKIFLPNKNQLSSITLDQPLGDVKKKDFRHSYSIKNDKTHVVVIPANCTTAGLEESLYRVAHCPFPKRLKVKSIDMEGRFLLMERFGENLQGYHWTSNNQKITKKDKEIADQIVKLMKEVITGDYTPKDLAPEFLLYDPKGKELKTHKVFVRMPFNFIQMDEFLNECSGGNKNVYQYLLQKSNLLEHPQADFVKKYINCILESDPNLDEIFIMHQITDVGFKHSAKEIRKEIENFVSSCKRSVQIKARKKILKIEQVIKKAILNDRGDDCCHFRLDDDYKSKIVKKVLKK